jgi:hypothetical protein
VSWFVGGEGGLGGLVVNGLPGFREPGRPNGPPSGGTSVGVCWW